MSNITFKLSSLLLTAVAFASTSHAQFNILPPSKSFEQERAEIAKQHEQIKAQFGGEVNDKELAAYINRVGQIVARNSDFPDKPFTFTVLDTPIPNAFTVGGGYVYITRGMLALMNDEAELVGVLGHECGHVTARHSARRETKMKWKQYETGILALLTRSALLVGAKNLKDSAGMLSYSRGQERQADSLGFKTLNKAGYDVDGMTGMLSSLQRFVRLQATMAGRPGEGEGPAWLSDHPATDERIRNMSIKAGLAKLTNPNQTKTNRAQYLNAIDGLMYGENPEQGTLRDAVFYHTEMDFAFGVHTDVRIENKPQAVIGVAGDSMAMIFTGMQWPADKSLEDYVSNTWLQLTAGSLGPVMDLKQTTINGLPSVVGNKRYEIRSPFSSAYVDLQTFVYRHSDDVVMHMSFISMADATSKYQKVIDLMGNSFRRMTDDDRKAAQPYRIKLVNVTPETSMGTFAEKMAFKRFKYARLTAINGIEDSKEFRQRKRIKIVVQGE